MIKVELYLYDAVERGIFETAVDEITKRRGIIQEQMQGNAKPGQRVPDTLTQVVADNGADPQPRPVVKSVTKPRKKAETVATIAPEAPAALEGDEAPMRPQTHGGALKSGGSPAPKKEETEVVITNVPVVSLDDARAKLQTFAEKQGLPAASKLLAEFGAKRIGDVDSKRLGAFVARLG